MKKYTPKKEYRNTIIGILLLVIILCIPTFIITPFIIPMKSAIFLISFYITFISVVFIIVRNMLPYGIFTITESGIEQSSFGLHKKIRFDEITEIHQIEIVSPHTYYGKYYVYLKSRDAKIKLSDFIQDYESLIDDVLNSCGKDTFEYREDKLNKRWVRKW